MKSRAFLRILVSLVFICALQIACNFPLAVQEAATQTVPTATLELPSLELTAAAPQDIQASPTEETPPQTAIPVPTYESGGKPNLALNKPVTASADSEGMLASMAVDGSLSTIWNAHDFPPAWIQIDLQSPQTVGLIRLYVSQTPAGATVHEVLGGDGMGGWQTLHTFSGSTNAGQVLEAQADTPWEGIRLIKIQTSESPSWVAWAEIEVYEP